MFLYAVDKGSTAINAIYPGRRSSWVRKVVTGGSLTTEQAAGLSFDMQQLSEVMWDHLEYLPDHTTMSKLIRTFTFKGTSEGIRALQEVLLERETSDHWSNSAFANFCAGLTEVSRWLDGKPSRLRAQVGTAIGQEFNALHRLCLSSGAETWYEELVALMAGDPVPMSQVCRYVERLEQWDHSLIDDLSIDPRVVVTVALLNLLATAETITGAVSLAKYRGGPECPQIEVGDLSYQLTEGKDDDIATAAMAVDLMACGIDPIRVMRMFCEPDGELIAVELLSGELYQYYLVQLDGREAIDPYLLAASARQLEDLCIDWYRTTYEEFEHNSWDLVPDDILPQARMRLLELVGFNRSPNRDTQGPSGVHGGGPTPEGPTRSGERGGA
jgi:hypothetical protein